MIGYNCCSAAPWPKSSSTFGIVTMRNEASGDASSRIEAFGLRGKLHSDGPTRHVQLDASPSEESGTWGARHTVVNKVPQGIISLVHRSSPSRCLYELSYCSVMQQAE